MALPVYLVPHLVARLKAETLRSATHLLLHDRTGQPWNDHTFRHVFATVRAAAAETLPLCAELRFMELRHTAVTRLSEAGVDDLAIAAITGHTPGSVRAVLDRHYLVRTERAAAEAFRRRIASETGGERDGGSGVGQS